jgi:hypothetical protein
MLHLAYGYKKDGSPDAVFLRILLIDHEDGFGFPMLSIHFAEFFDAVSFIITSFDLKDAVVHFMNQLLQRIVSAVGRNALGKTNHRVFSQFICVFEPACLAWTTNILTVDDLCFVDTCILCWIVICHNQPPP